jgi:hypothetical protein
MRHGLLARLWPFYDAGGHCTKASPSDEVWNDHDQLSWYDLHPVRRALRRSSAEMESGSQHTASQFARVCATCMRARRLGRTSGVQHSAKECSA